MRRELCGDPRDQSKNGQVLQEAKRRLKRALAAKEGVVWDGTNLIRDLRLSLLSIGRAYGALTELVVFPRSLARCVAGVKTRERMLPTAVIERQIARSDWPTEDEAHIMLYRCRCTVTRGERVPIRGERQSMQALLKPSARDSTHNGDDDRGAADEIGDRHEEV
ncbi:MAG: AAA family ATPase, partial [Myxococcota bacterium]|nr:AAA family ATPase [Myxococcota bacterium]